MPEQPSVTAVVARRVLIIDDHVDSAELAGIHLELRGHVVRIASRGGDALLAALDFRPQVAIIDIWLGLSASYSLSRQLRLLPGLASVRLIGVTGFVGSDLRRASAAEGVEFFRCLTKPINPSALASAVENEPALYTAG